MENTENNGMGMPGNAMWGNMNWGNTPPWWNYGPGYGYGRGGAGGVATAGLITCIIGSVLGLATGGFGLAGMGRGNGWGANGYGPNGKNLYDQVQAFGVSAILSLVDFRISQLAAQYAEQADMLGLIDRKTGNVNLAAVEHVLLNGTQWPQQVGPFKFDKADAEKIMAAVKAQDQTLKGQAK